MANPEIVAQILTELRGGVIGKQRLTIGDLELIKQLCLPDKVISYNIGLSSVNVRKRISRLAFRFGVENRTALLVRALKLGLVGVDELVFREYDDGENLFRKSN